MNDTGLPIPAEKVVAAEWAKFMAYLVMKLGGEVKCDIRAMVKEFETRKLGTYLACIGDNSGAITLKVLTDEEAAILIGRSVNGPER